MKSLFIISLLALSCSSLCAQKEEGTYVLTAVPHPDEDQFIVLEEEVTIQDNILRGSLVDANNELISTFELSLLRRSLLYNYEGSFFWNGKFHVVTSLYYPGPQQYHLILRSYALPSLEETGARVLDEAFTADPETFPFGYSLSREAGQLAVYTKKNGKPQEEVRIKVQLMDNAKDTARTSTFNLPYTNKKLLLLGADLTGDGRLLLYCENYDGDPERRIREEQFRYDIVALDNRAGTIEVIPVVPPGQVVQGMKIRLLDGERVLGAAFYRSEGNKRLEGLYTFELKTGATEAERQVYPIDKRDYKDAYPREGNEPFLNPNKEGFENYFVDYILPDSAGNLQIVAEQRSEEELYDSFTDEYFVVSSFNDVLSIKINDGRLAELHRFPKRQVSQSGTWSIYSYLAYLKNGNLYMLYNELPGNFRDLKLGRRLQVNTGGGALPFVARIEKPGESQIMSPLFGDLNKAASMGRLWPVRSAVQQNDELLLFLKSGNTTEGRGDYIRVSR